MKIIKVFFLSVIIVISIGLGSVLIFFITFDLDQYRLEAMKSIGSMVGREVFVEQLKFGFTISKGVTFIGSEFSVSDDNNFSKESFLTANLIYLNVDFFKFIFEKKIVISQIEVRSPSIRIIRNSKGILNTQTIGQGKQVADTSGKNQLTSVSSRTVLFQDRNLSVLSLVIDRINIVDGSLIYFDNPNDPKLIVPLHQVGIKIKDFSLSHNKPFLFQMDAALWSDHQNIHGRGELLIDLNNARVYLDHGKLEADLSKMLIRGTPIYPILKEKLLLDGDLSGKVVLDDIRVIAGEDGIKISSLHGMLTGGQVNFEFFHKPIEDIHVDFQMDENGMDIKDFGFLYALGRVNVHGRVSDYGRSNMFILECQAEDIQAADLIPNNVIPVWDVGYGVVRLEGRFGGSFNIEGEGAQLAQWQESLRGDGFFEVREAKLTNINLLHFVLDKISFLPNLAKDIDAKLSPPYSDKLKGSETLLNQVTLKVDARNRAVIFKANIGSDAFGIESNGRLGFDQNLELAADFFISEDLSNIMSGVVEELGSFRNQEGRIYIPFKLYQGRYQDVQISPDIKQLSKLVIRNKSQEDLRKVIFKVLNVKPVNEVVQPISDETTSQPNKKLFDTILDVILNDDQK